MKILTWTMVDVNGTSLLGYLEDTGLVFEELVARLVTLSGQTPRNDGYKCSVEFEGTFGGQPFTLYDYKGDDTIHIGGRDGLDVDGLVGELTTALRTVAPTPYEATRHYDDVAGTTHSWEGKP